MNTETTIDRSAAEGTIAITGTSVPVVTRGVSDTYDVSNDDLVVHNFCNGFRLSVGVNEFIHDDEDTSDFLGANAHWTANPGSANVPANVSHDGTHIAVSGDQHCTLFVDLDTARRIAVAITELDAS